MTVTSALISVSDKTGVVELAQSLNKLKIKIISSGGTANVLKQHNIDCREISDITGFSEILDGRVKTLHPKIHGGILAKRGKPSHIEQLNEHAIQPIDLVVVSLYPFEDTIARIPASSTISEDAIEKIDIGGVALLRAAAKNFHDVLVVCEAADYKCVIEKIEKNELDINFRRELAAKAFRHTAYYDSVISGYFSTEKFPEKLAVPLKKLSPLRYGENPHQQAAVYLEGSSHTVSPAVGAKQLQGKELSYNNYLDLESAWELIKEFKSYACAIIKHNNPCGCAAGKGLLDAYSRALACDPVSAFGGIIAFNREVDEALALEVIKLFTECVIGPSYTESALKIFASKKNLRILIEPLETHAAEKNELSFRSISGGMLIQDKDNALLTENKTVTIRVPSAQEKESLDFAWKICKHVKSNAIILVRGTQTVGVGAGQMSRIDSLKIASEKMKEITAKNLPNELPLVLASDAFFPFPDVVTESAKLGITAIIQPGGSLKDEDSIKAANTQNIAMQLTSMRHFRH